MSVVLDWVVEEDEDGNDCILQQEKFESKSFGQISMLH